MADVDLGTPDPTTTAVAPDTSATPSPSASEASAAPASATADDTVSKVRKIYESMEGGSSPSAPATPPSPAQAATAPGGTTAASQAPATPKAIPLPDHQRVISTTRTKTRNETLTEYGITDGITPAHVKHGVTFVRLYEANPQLALKLLQEQIGGSPAGTTPAAPADPEPEPDLDLGNGQFAYSAERLKEVRAWERRQIDADVKKTYGPVLDAHQRAEADRIGSENANLAVSGAKKDWHLFDKLQPQIVEQLKALPENIDVTPQMFFQLYQRVYRAHAPAIMRAELDRERASEVALKTKGSSARPSAAQAVTPRTGKLTTLDKVRQIYDRKEAELAASR
jgi:hypothetical protein